MQSALIFLGWVLLEKGLGGVVTEKKAKELLQLKDTTFAWHMSGPGVWEGGGKKSIL